MASLDRFALADGSFQHALLRDRARLDAYAEGVAKAVRPGDVVADLGSGSGVLAFLAARAGAARVYAVESHPPAVRHARALLALNGAGERVEVVEADVESWSPPGSVDVVLAELMETGLLHEPIAAALRRAHTAWPAPPRAVVPRRARLLVEGVALRDVFHGYRAPLPGLRAEGSGEPLTDAACYAEVDLHRAPPEGVEALAPLRARAAGTVDALRLRTDTEVAPGRWFGGGPAHCTPLVLPLPRSLRVADGERLHASLRYGFAFDAGPLEYALSAG